jgi:hypothetical protein
MQKLLQTWLVHLQQLILSKIWIDFNYFLLFS